MTTFFRRVVSALGLDPQVFEEVEADRTALGQALVVVLLAGLGAGIGNTGLRSDGGGAIVAVTIVTVVGWVGWAWVIARLGTRVMPSPSTSADLGQVLRTLGFAAAPAMFRAFEAVGGLRWVLLPLTSVWMVMAMIIAIRQALDYSTTWQAVRLALLGWLVMVGAAIVVGLLLARPVS
jgi:hypothetical protein